MSTNNYPWPGAPPRFYFKYFPAVREYRMVMEITGSDHLYNIRIPSYDIVRGSQAFVGTYRVHTDDDEIDAQDKAIQSCGQQIVEMLSGVFYTLDNNYNADTTDAA